MTVKQSGVNLYSLVDRELDRMYDLMKLHATKARSTNDTFHQMYGARDPLEEVLSRRITLFQDVLLEALKTHDSAIQEKVAELALTGKGEING
jgi:hypothetical protein